LSATAINWLVVLVYFSITLGLGERLGRGQRDLSDYFLAGRRMPWWSACLSIVGTETSTLTFVGVPAIAYTGDLTFLQVALGYVVGRFLVAWWLVPAYFAGEIETAYQVLADRFGERAQAAASLVFLVSRSLADGVRLFATALVLQALLPMPLWVAISGVAGVTLIYTLRGGLRAVIWNDAVQLGIYMGGAVVALAILASRLPDGLAAALGTLAADGRLRVFDLAWDPSQAYTFWAGILGGAVLTMATHGTDQMFVQRLLSCGTIGSARRAVIGSGILVFAQMALFLLIGSLLAVFFSAYPPEPALTTPDQAFPRFIADQMPPGLGGLVIAAVFAAAMSTLSSSMSSLASASTLDFALRGSRRRRLDDEASLRLSRRSTLVWAFVLAAVAGMAQAWGSVLEAGLTITSITFGGVLGIFLVAALGWRLSDRAAVAALLTGVLAALVVQQTTTLAWTWLTPLGALATLLVAALAGDRSPASER
jgi:SSS family solute:Na+ symporter